MKKMPRFFSSFSPYNFTQWLKHIIVNFSKAHYTTLLNLYIYIILCTCTCIPVQFVQRNRVESSRLTMTSLSQIHSTLEQRVKLVQGRHVALLAKEKGLCAWLGTN